MPEKAVQALRPMTTAQMSSLRSNYLSRLLLANFVQRPIREGGELAGVFGQNHNRSGQRALDTAHILIELSLQLPNLLQRPLSQNGKAVGIPSQDLIAVRFQDALHPPHLLDGLISLFGCLDHNVSRSSPFLRPGRCRTWLKNTTASAKLSVPILATTISNPKRRRTRCCASTLYWYAGKSAPKSWEAGTTTIRSMSFGSALPVTKLPSTTTPTTTPVLAASERNISSFSNNLGRRSEPWKKPNRALISAGVQSCTPTGRKPFASRDGIGIAANATSPA